MSQKNRGNNPFTTLRDLLGDLITSIDSLFTQHVDNSKLQTIVDQLTLLQADVLAIKAFLGISGPIPLSAGDQRALDEVSQETLRLKNQAEGIDVQPPPQ